MKVEPEPEPEPEIKSKYNIQGDSNSVRKVVNDITMSKNELISVFEANYPNEYEEYTKTNSYKNSAGRLIEKTLTDKQMRERLKKSNELLEPINN